MIRTHLDKSLELRGVIDKQGYWQSNRVYGGGYLSNHIVKGLQRPH